MSLKKRNSSIELLKVFAIIIIIISHSVPYGASYSNYDGFIDINVASSNINVVLLAIIRYFGQIGNAIFIICSSWFLVDSKGVNKKKIVKIIFDAFLISLLIFLFIKFALKYDIPKDTYAKTLFPIVHNSFWFITCYLLLYLCHPFLNYIIDKINKMTHLKIVLFLIFIYSILCLFVNTDLYYNPLVGFICVYFITTFIKKYMKDYNKNTKLNIIILFFSIMVYILSLFFINYISLRYNKNIGLLKYCTFLNPIIMLISISLFNIFSSKDFYNGIINKISSMTLMIYFIHGNFYIMGYCKGRYFDYILYSHNYKYIVIYTLILAFIYFSVSIIAALLYNKIMSLSLYKLFDKVYINASNKINNILKKISLKLH